MILFKLTIYHLPPPSYPPFFVLWLFCLQLKIEKKNKPFNPNPSHPSFSNFNYQIINQFYCSFFFFLFSLLSVYITSALCVILAFINFFIFILTRCVCVCEWVFFVFVFVLGQVYYQLLNFFFFFFFFIFILSAHTHTHTNTIHKLWFGVWLYLNHTKCVVFI